jgi:hypothetical protein
MHRSLLLPTLLGLAMLPASAIADEEFCEHDTRSECSLDEFSIVKNSRCREKGLFACYPHYQPPGVTQFNCRERLGVYSCTTYPQGPGVSYEYYAGHGVTVSDPGPTTAPTVQATCTGSSPATVTVTVTSPFGISSSESMLLPCGALTY